MTPATIFVATTGEFHDHERIQGVCTTAEAAAALVGCAIADMVLFDVDTDSRSWRGVTGFVRRWEQERGAFDFVSVYEFAVCAG